MRYKIKEDSSLKILQSKLPKIEFDMLSFWEVCPFAKQELGAYDRSTEVCQWRQVAIVWEFFCSENIYLSENYGVSRHMVYHAGEKLLGYLDSGIEDPLFDKFEEVVAAAVRHTKINLPQHENDFIRSQMLLQHNFLQRFTNNEFFNN